MQWTRLYFFLLFLPALFWCRQGNAKQEPQITIGVRSDTVDVCESQQRSLIIVYAKNIAIPDSILGYTIELRYNPDKLYLTDEIFSGTLTESFNDHKLTFPEPGVATGWAVNTLRPVKTSTDNQPLIAMRGRFLGNCTDTVHVVVKDISFVHVQDDNVVDIDGNVEQDGLVVGTIRDKSERHVLLKTDTDIVRFTGIEEAPIITAVLENAGGKGIDTMSMELYSSNAEQFFLSDIESGDEKVKIVEKVLLNDTWFVKVVMEEGWSNLLTFVVATRHNRTDVGTVVVRPVQVNACACVTQLLESSIELQSVEKIEVRVDEESVEKRDIHIGYTDDGWQVYTGSSVLKSVRVVNAIGQEVVFFDNLQAQTVHIDNASMARGIYMIQVRTGEHNMETITIRKL